MSEDMIFLSYSIVILFFTMIGISIYITYIARRMS